MNKAIERLKTLGGTPKALTGPSFRVGNIARERIAPREVKPSSIAKPSSIDFSNHRRNRFQV